MKNSLGPNATFSFNRLASALAMVLNSARKGRPEAYSAMGGSARNVLFGALSGGVMLIGGNANAATDWIGGVDSQWATAANWSPMGTPNAAGLQVQFVDGDASLNGKTLSLGSSTFTLGSLAVGGIDNRSLRAFTLSGGTLNFNNAGADSLISLSGNRAVTINSAITSENNLHISNTSPYGTNLTLGGTLNGGANSLIFDSGINTKIVANGVIANTALVTKNGVGTLALNAANTFANNFNFDAGTIIVGNNAAFGTSTIVLANGGNPIFDVSSGSRTLSNQVALNDGFSVLGSGKTLTLSASQNSPLTGVLTLNTGNVATLDLGSAFALQGAGSLVKNGYGSLVLESKNNTFAGGLNVQQGIVNTGSFTDNLVIGATDGANHMLGTGDISLTDSSSALNINAAADGTVNFAGSRISAINGAKINVLNGAAVTLSGGTLDFGTGAAKGALNFTGSVTLGNASFLHAVGAAMTIGKDLTFMPGSTIGQSGIDLILSSATAQKINGTGNINGLNGLTKTGGGTATVQSGLTGLGVSSLSALGGVLDLGDAAIVTNTVNLGGGTVNLHQTNQLSSRAKLFLLDDTRSILNFNGYDQSYSGINSITNGQLTLDMGGASSTANTISLGALTGTAGALRISGWDGSLTSSFDRVLINGLANAEQLSSVWFQGYGKGAVQVDNELLPVANISSEWKGTANDGLWNSGINWVGDDAYNVPNHTGAAVTFGNKAGNLVGKTVSLAGATRTVGSIIGDSSISSGRGSLRISNGTLIFDSGAVGGVSHITATAANNVWLLFGTDMVFNNDVVVNSENGIIYFSGPSLNGNGRVIVNGGQLRFTRAALAAAAWNGGITLRSGQILVYSNNNLGTGDLRIESGAIGTQFNTNKYSINNRLDIAGDFTADYVRFTHAGDLVLDAVHTINTNGLSVVPGEIASTTFSADVNFTGSGGLIKSGSGTLEILSPNGTFGGGLSAINGTLFTTLSSDLTLGQLNAGHNYLGSADVSVGSATGSATISVNSAGYAGSLSDSVLNLNNQGQFKFLNGGAFILASGTLDGGTGSKGTLTVAGDLTFDGTALVNMPGIVVATSTNLTGASRVYSGNDGVISGLSSFTKAGSGTTILDSSVTSLAADNIYLTGGVLQLSANNQIASTSNFVLNGGALNANNFTDSLGKLYLRNDSSLLLGSSGGLTFSSVAGGAADWVDGKILTLQNEGQDWTQAGSTYVRFSANPDFTSAQLSNIAFTGYESGSVLSTSRYGGFWTLQPEGLVTNEWSGASGVSNNWSHAGNWLTGVVPDGAGKSATVRDADSSLNSKIINVDADYSVGRLNIESSSGQSLTLGGSGVLTFDGNGANSRFRHAGLNTVTFSANSHLAGTLAYADTVANTAGYLDWSGRIAGSGDIIKTGAGTLRLSGGSANTYTGGFLWQDASLIQLNSNGSLFGTGGLTIGDNSDKTYSLETRGGSLAVDGPVTLAGNLMLQKDTNLGIVDASTSVGRMLTLNGPVTLASGSKTINVYSSANAIYTQTDNVALNLNGRVTGSGHLYKNGLGFIYLNGTGNDFSGGFTLNRGGVSVAHDRAFGSGLLTLESGTFGVLATTNASQSSPLVFDNRLTLANGTTMNGYIKFDYSGISTLTNIFSLAQTGASSLVVFGKDHVLAGSGGLQKGSRSVYASDGILRLEGANTFSGRVDHQFGTIQVGVDSVKEGSGLLSSALGIGTYHWNGGTLSAYSDTGSLIASRRVSNPISLNNSTSAFTRAGDATTLILDTPTITLRNGKLDWAVTGHDAAAILSVESRFIDADAATKGGITLLGRGTMALKNANNQISDGIRVNSGEATLLATAVGDVTTGVLDADHNYLGTGRLIIDSGTVRIATTDGSTVRLSGLGMNMNDAGSLMISGGSNIRTLFDSNSLFTGTNTTGSIAASGQLIKDGAGTTTWVGAKLAAPELVLNSNATLSLTNTNLVAGVGQLSMNGGTLAVNGLNQTFSPSMALVLNADSHIDFGSAGSIVTVGSLDLSSDGKSVGHSALTLSLDNWSGLAGSGGGADQFRVTSGLTDGQKLYNVWFTGGYSPGAKALINPNGQIELVPLGNAYIWKGTVNTANGQWQANSWTDVGSPNSVGDAAIFTDLDTSINGQTISTGSGVTVGSISFESTGGQAFTLSGGAITLDTGDANQPSLIRLIGNASPTIASELNLKRMLTINENGSGFLTLSGAITGPNTSITKTGVGTLALLSGASNFTNGLTVDGGMLQIGASSAVDALGGVSMGPVGVGRLSLNNGSFIQAINGAQILHNGMTFNGLVNAIGPNALTLAGSAAMSGNVASATTLNVADATGLLTFGANLPLTGSSDLTKTGAGTLNFNASRGDFSGRVMVNAGAIGIGSNGGFGNGSVMLNNGTTLAANATGLSVANGIVLGTGSQTITTGAHHLTLGGTISGSGKLLKTGSGTLTLSNTSIYSGGTALTNGSITLANADGAGSGAIALAAGTTLHAGFSDSVLDNALTGGGTVNIRGSNIMLDADNTAFSGRWSVDNGASAQAGLASSLGSVGVAINGTGVLRITPASDHFIFDNALTGSGILSVALGASTGQFSFGSNVGSAFTGNAAVSGGLMTVDDNASVALTNATLRLDSGGKVQASGNQSVGNLHFNGGMLIAGLNSTGQVVDSISAGELVLTNGVVQLDLSAISTASGVLLTDDGIVSQLAATTGVITGSVANLQIVGADGMAPGASTLQDITQGGRAVAKGTYTQSLSSSGDGGNGLYLGYQLNQLDLQASQLLTLNESTATGNAAELKAKITGSGNLNVAATSTITISNGANSYTGATTVSSGTAKAGLANVFFNSNAMTINSGATLDMNAKAQQLNNLSGAGTVLLSSTLSANSTADTLFSGVLNGNSLLIKTGSGQLSLSGVNTLGGGTQVDGGTVRVLNNQSLGTTAVTVASGGNLALAFNGAGFNNVVSGAGRAIVSGNNVALTAANTLSGVWDISGSARANAMTHLGSATVNLNGATSALSMTPAAGNLSFANRLTGSGTLTAQLASNASSFDFTSGAGNSFSGIFDLKTGALALSGNNTVALTNATLAAGAGSVVTVGHGNQQIGGLSFAGGHVIFDATVPAQSQANGIITAQRLDLNGAGTVQVAVPNKVLNPSVLPIETNLLAQDDSGAMAKLAVLGTSGSIIGAGGALRLVDQNGVAISNGKLVDISNGTAKVATGTYDYRLNTGTANDGLYIAYALKNVAIEAGQTLTLTPSLGASGLATDLSATLTGTGNVDVDAGVGKTLSLTNSLNRYSGTTLVSSGTLQLGANSVLGNTSNLSIASGAAADLNNFSQTVDTFTGSAGSVLNLNGGALSISHGGISAGSLTGAGTLALNGNDLAVSGANSGLAANVTIAAGASSRLSHVAGLGNTGTTTVIGALTIDNATGTLSKSLAGTGRVNLTNAANVTLSGTHSLSGSWNTAAGTTLTATAETSLGRAAINNGGSMVVDSATDWTIANALNGIGSLAKRGSGELTIGTANSRSGSTSVSGGKLTLTHSGALGGGNVVVSTATGSAQQGLNLAFGTDQSFANVLSGNGVTSVAGAGMATITGINTGYAGGWAISGNATVDSATASSSVNLGSGAVDLASGGILNVHSHNAFAFTNALTGGGRLNVSNNDHAFSFSTGNAFTGTVALADNQFDLSGTNTAALGGATLLVGSGNVTTVGSGIQHIGGLALAGGKINFTATRVPAHSAAEGSITVGTLAVTAASEIAINTATGGLINPTRQGSTNLLAQDDNAQVKLVGASRIAAGSSAGNLTLVDAAGAPVTHAAQVDIVEGGFTAAVGTYDYALTFGSANDGLYLGYGLKQLNLLAGNRLTLAPEAGASVSASDLNAKLTGGGSLAINAGNGQAISLSNATNNYTGETVAQTGTLQLGADTALGRTSNLAINRGASVDMNGRSQTVGALSAYAGGVLNLSGILTISDAQRAVGSTDGGLVDNNTLFSNGSLVIDPSIVHVNGTQLGYSGRVQVTGGSRLVLNAANAFDNAHGITLVSAADNVTFGDLSGYHAPWTATPIGTTKVGFSGVGTVELRDGASIALTGDSSGFGGTFDIAGGSTLTDSGANSVGTAAIHNAGKLIVNASSDRVFNNAVSGNGSVEKIGSGTVWIDSALSNFTGSSMVSDGVLIVGERVTSGARMAGDLAVGTNGLLSGTGTISGNVVNNGRIVAYNVLPGVNGYGDNSVSNLTTGALTNSGAIQLAGQSVGNTLTVRGGMTGTGGSVAINTVLGNDGSATDRLILDGGNTTGSTHLVVLNQQGTGAQTNIGILVVDAINGATTDGGAFTLSSASSGYRSTTGTIAAGAYDYRLVRGGTGGNADSWYLSSGGSGASGCNNCNTDNMRPEAGIYGGNMQASLAMFMMSLRDREGYTHTGSGQGIDDGLSSWGRVMGSHSTGSMGGALSTSADMTVMQVGADLLHQYDPQNGSLYAGIMGGWGYASTDSDSRRDNQKSASGSVNGYSLGVYGTWYQNDKKPGGAYIDGWAQHGWFSNDVNGGGLPKEEYDARAVTLSVETGYGYMLSEQPKTRLFIEPQVQVAYAWYNADGFRDHGGTRVGIHDGDGYIARAGARLYGVHEMDNGQTVRPFVEVNYWHNQNVGRVVMGNDSVQNGTPKNVGEIKTGVVTDVSKNWQATGQIGTQSGGDFTAVTGQLGVKYSW
ncbi:autotransporter outer membrane beta-barrel domain-containing protein [Budvicia diplopodorum]|uniref:autotransporter outer membrane beta-barrel domain-containing protein n=1 Tax=Budvicia diplopodorum TaxID=1119056 RepID=UPI001357C32A|nr:autotransporter outer membrane beta-barrel domain-containing protein [Budvicia diplopodorum]